MRKLTIVLLFVFVLTVAFSSVALAANGATKADLKDACVNIGPAFCGDNGSKAPGAKGFVVFNPTPKNKDVLRVVVKKSLPKTDHEVFACTGEGDFGAGGGGYSNCTALGTLKTNVKGNGNFNLNYAGAFDPAWTVIVVNTATTGTILATTDPIQ